VSSACVRLREEEKGKMEGVSVLLRVGTERKRGRKRRKGHRAGCCVTEPGEGGRKKGKENKKRRERLCGERERSGSA
jgi:hypothetical protein